MFAYWKITLTRKLSVTALLTWYMRHYEKTENKYSTVEQKLTLLEYTYEIKQSYSPRLILQHTVYCTVLILYWSWIPKFLVKNIIITINKNLKETLFSALMPNGRQRGNGPPATRAETRRHLPQPNLRHCNRGLNIHICHVSFSFLRVNQIIYFCTVICIF